MTSPRSTDIVVFGAGRIGGSLARGIAEAEACDADVFVTTRSGVPSARTEGLSLLSNVDGATRAGYVFICTKPQDTAALLDEIRDHLRPDAVIVSFVSGLTTRWFEARLGAGRPVVRVMTTLAIELGCGASVVSSGAHATTDHVSVVSSLLAAVGTSVEAPEDYLDAVSGISGGGIAYFYFLVEVMTQAGVNEGLPVDLARDLLVQTAIGAGEMMRASGRHPAQLREDVMSRGGQTIAAFRELERHNVRDALFDAVAAAHARGRELATQSELPFQAVQVHERRAPRASASDTKTTVHSAEAPKAAGPYSHGAISRGTLFCSGQIALDPVSNVLLHSGDVAGQVTQCLDNLNAVAVSAGTDLREHGLRTTIYVANLDRDWPIVNEAYGRWFGDATPPARVTFGVAALPLGASVEIDAYIAVP